MQYAICIEIANHHTHYRYHLRLAGLPASTTSDAMTAQASHHYEKYDCLRMMFLDIHIIGDTCIHAGHERRRYDIIHEVLVALDNVLDVTVKSNIRDCDCTNVATAATNDGAAVLVHLR